ncbi:MAG: 1-deoxy-D-xylulose-5-phosphate synthase [Bacilli bacterium]|nr:1-deoxy-D-xylulose-5-phosphate synthase [Bacilli bacterium]
MTNKHDKISLNSKTIESEIKTADYDVLNELCADIRKEIVEATAKNGGHLSSNLGAVELTVAIHRNFDLPKDKLIFDVGHQSYTHKLLSGRSLKGLGQKDGVSEFQKLNESPFDPFSAGHSSTSISAAEGFAIVRDQNKEDYNVVALVGDAAVMNGLALEAINHLSYTKSKVIIVLNDNEMSITSPIGGFQKCGFDAVAKLYEDMGFKYVGPIDGHDLKALDEALSEAKKSDRTVLIHCKTKKGKGYAPSEVDDYGYWHATSPFDIETGKPLDLHPNKISWSHYCADLAEEILEKYPNTNLIVPATLKGSNLDVCFAKFPTRTFDVGIAEEHALTLASAMALAGSHPIVTIYSTFMQRAYDEILHDCARQHANITVFVDRAGLTGMTGATHNGIYDVAYLMTIPDVVITMPSTKNEALTLAKESLGKHGVFFIRAPREFLDKEDANLENLPFGRWRFVEEKENKKLIIVGVGPDGRELNDLLKANGIEASYVNPLYLNSFDKDDVAKLLGYENILVYDSYGVENGFASKLGSVLMKAGYKGNFIAKAIGNDFVSHMSIKEQKSLYGLNPEEMLEFIKATY